MNIKKKSNVRLFKYEIFDYLIKNNIFKPNQGIQTIQEFVNILNPNNDYNIFNIYMNSYSNKEIISINHENLDFSLFDKSITTSIPILKRGEVTPTYNELHQLVY